MNENTSSKRNYSTIFIFLLILILGYTGYLISDLNKQNYKITKELSLLLMENNEMNKVLLNEDALSNSKSGNLKDNLKLLLFSYDSLEYSSNELQRPISCREGRLVLHENIKTIRPLKDGVIARQ